MTRTLNRNIYRSILIASFVGLNVLILFGISSVLAYLNTGADRSTMLHAEVKKADAYLPKITWANTENPGRKIEEQALAKIQKDYLNAWYVRNIAYKTNNPYGTEDFFTDNAQENILENIGINKQKNIHIDVTTISHEPALKFYSTDGQLVVFTDKKVVGYQKTYLENELMLATTDTSAYKVMMLLEDGFWRIRHMEKIKPEATIVPVAEKRLFTVENGQVLAEGKPFTIKGVNYYPQATPWDMFGDGFDEGTIAKDLKIVKDAGLNSIRIFLQYGDFGKADVGQEKLKKLKAVLDLAESSGIKVVVTLFDFYGDYSVLDWTLTHRHAEQIVSAFKDHPAIIAWDLKNEPDLDFDSRGKENVLAWLSRMVKEVRKYDPNHLVTIGWSSPVMAAHLKEEVDFVSFHYYMDIDDFENHCSELKNKVPGKPLVLQEFGVSSYSGIWKPFGSSKKRQAEYHKKMQAFLKKEELAFMSWTLYDYHEIPTSVVGRLPWRKSKQKYFGFLDSKGNPKPAFQFISN